MAKNKNQRSYRQYKGPQSSPMWRDPSHAGKSGCVVFALAVLGGLGALVGAVGHIVG